MSIPRFVVTALVTSAFGVAPVLAQTSPLNLDQATRTSAHGITMMQPIPVAVTSAAPEPFNAGPPNFLELLFGGLRPPFAPQLQNEPASPPEPSAYSRQQPEETGDETGAARRRTVDPKYLPQVVTYSGSEKPGTIIVDTPARFLYLVQENGRAMRYGIGVGRPGFTWAGVKQITAKREWPDWTPPEEMLQRRPDLPHFMAGGPENPLGARAMYLGSSLYRIHGSNEPWTIGQAVSSGCIRMRNQDVTDLYSRVKVGTKVIVI